MVAVPRQRAVAEMIERQNVVHSQQNNLDKINVNYWSLSELNLIQIKYILIICDINVQKNLVLIVSFSIKCLKYQKS